MNLAITKENASLETLSNVPYSSLYETFESLGIKECWKPGTKAKVMIKEALDKIAIMKSLETNGKTDDEIKDEAEKEFDKQAEANKSAAEDAELIEAKKRKEVELKQINKIKEMKLSPEQIEKNLALIELNLKNGVPAQRNILLNKKKVLLEMLEESLS